MNHHAEVLVDKLVEYIVEEERLSMHNVDETYDHDSGAAGSAKTHLVSKEVVTGVI